MKPARAFSPRVSVVMATRNSGQYLEESLHSIASQGLVPYEVIVVDAQSTDDTLAILATKPWVSVVGQIGIGLPNAWNQGLRLVSGDFVAMIDSDDFWSRDYLSTCVDQLSEEPSAGYALANVRFFTPDDERPPGLRVELIGAERVGNMPGSTVFRRDVFTTIGYFPEDLAIASDIAWFARLRDSGMPALQVPIVGLHKRMHGENLSLDPGYAKQYQHELLRIARDRIKAFERDESSKGP